MPGSLLSRRNPHKWVTFRSASTFQEHANAKYGLASPKDNRRVAFTDASEMISRYKGDAFAGANRDLKASILEAMLARNIMRHDDFRALLAEYGGTRTRNAGRDVEYENVKPHDAAKGVNLKEYVFSREFIELDAGAKRAALASGIHSEYIEPGVPRETSVAYLNLLNEWHAVRAREIKYLNSGSSFYETYRNASPDEQRRLLAHREARFYQRTGGLDERGIEERSGRRRSRGPGNWRDWRSQGRARGHEREPGAGREPEWKQTNWEALEREHQEIIGRWRAGADHDFDARFDRSDPATRSFDRVRGVPRSGLDGDAARREVLLPPDALLELGNQQAKRTDALRWSGDREREGGLTGGLTADAGAPDWRTIAQRMYAAWEQADATERTRLTRTGADKFMAGGGPFGARQAFGMNRALGGLSGGRMPREFGFERQTRSMAEIGSFDAIASIPFETGPVSDATGPSFNRRARAATGREADTVRDQFARDLSEARARRSTTGTPGTTGVADERSEFAEIRATLDASRLLAALAHSHGLIVEKYQIGKGRDGADRIKAGSRHLNASDFLTKEMNLSWADAAQLLRDTYQAQTGRIRHTHHGARQSVICGQSFRRGARRTAMRCAANGPRRSGTRMSDGRPSSQRSMGNAARSQTGQICRRRSERMHSRLPASSASRARRCCGNRLSASGMR